MENDRAIPLQGIIKGRPVALHVLDYGLFRVHANSRIIGICGYLIRTDADENILIDTGFPAKYARDAKAASAEDRLDEFGEVLACTPDNLPAAQLALLGLNTGDITLHVLTHSHIDHIGGLGDFPQAPILINATERALPRPLYWGQVQPVAWPKARYIVIDQDTEIAQGLSVLMAPGHSPGQMALWLTLPQTGAVLLTSDAISRPAEIDEKFAGAWDQEMACASADRLMTLAAQSGAFVIYGHCPEQWPNLRKAPEGYV